MSIKSLGGVFGRNPTFRNVEVEGNLTVDGTLTIGGSVITGLNLQGNWDAATNTPDLTVLTPPAGQFWIVSVAGSTNLGGITNWTVGDWALYDGSGWQRVEGGTVDLSNGVTGTLAITNGGTGASTASTARTNLGSGTVGDNLFTATTALAAQQAMDTEVGVDVQPYDATILKSADIGVTVEAYDSTILKSADIGVTVQGYDSTILNAADIGVTVEAYDATILKSADIGSTVQGYDADTAKYDDTTANFIGTLQNGGSNVVVDTDIGSTVQAYDADTAKLDVAQTWTAAQTFNGGAVFNESGADVDFRIESDTDANAFFLDGATGNIGLGTSSPAGKLTVNVEGFPTIAPATSPGLVQIIQQLATINKAGGSGLEFKASSFGSGYGVKLLSENDGAFVIANRNNNASFSERMRIDQNGNVTVSSGNVTLATGNLVIGTSGKGIDFSATSGTGTSELLDDYEEGTWTPEYSSASGAFGSITYDTAVTGGKYTKVGNLVHIQGGIRTDAITVGTASGGIRLSGLPFTAIASGTGQDGWSTLTVGQVAAFAGDVPSTGSVVAGQSYIELQYRSAANGATIDLAVADLDTGADDNLMRFSATYIAG